MRVQTSAKKVKFSEARGISCLRVCEIGRPVSRVSSSASCGTLRSISSPRRRISRARSLAGVPAHLGKASAAGATAASISAWPPAATSSMASPVAGLKVVKRSALSTCLPLIQCLMLTCVSSPWADGRRQCGGRLENLVNSLTLCAGDGPVNGGKPLPRGRAGDCRGPAFSL